MSKKDEQPQKMITVELTEEETQILANLLRSAPIQGTMLTLPKTLEKLIVLQEKLSGSLEPQSESGAGL